MIDAELGREDHSSIPCKYNRDETGTTWYQKWHPNQIKPVVEKKNIDVKYYIENWACQTILEFFYCNWVIYFGRDYY
jgi:hypothetical protein